MTSGFEVGRRNAWRWALPLGFCALNLLGIALFSSTFAGKVERLESQHRRAIDQLEALREERGVIVEFLEKAGAHEGQADGLYSEYFQTEAQRFTRVIQEVKRLARQAGLKPASLSYPKKDFGAYDLLQRDIGFGVDGTYDQLRTFVNFLELTDQFIILNSVTLGGRDASGQNPRLGINLRLSTIFAKREVEDQPAEPST